MKVSFINQFKQGQRSQDNLFQHCRHHTKTQSKPTQETLANWSTLAANPTYLAHLNQTKPPNQTTKPMQTKPNQTETKPNETKKPKKKPYQTNPTHNKPNQTISNQTKLKKNKTDQTKPNESTQTQPSQIKINPTPTKLYKTPKQT